MDFVPDLGCRAHSEMFATSNRGFISRNKNVSVWLFYKENPLFPCCRHLFDPLLKPVESTRGKAKSSKGYERFLRCPKHHMEPIKQRESLPIPLRGRVQNPGFSGLFWSTLSFPLEFRAVVRHEDDPGCQFGVAESIRSAKLPYRGVCHRFWSSVRNVIFFWNFEISGAPMLL